MPTGTEGGEGKARNDIQSRSQKAWYVQEITVAKSSLADIGAWSWTCK